MRSQIKLRRVFGIRIGLHYSWFVIAFLIVVSIASLFHQNNPAWDRSFVFVLALSQSSLNFAEV